MTRRQTAQSMTSRWTINGTNDAPIATSLLKLQPTVFNYGVDFRAIDTSDEEDVTPLSVLKLAIVESEPIFGTL
ncbi:hypothetical protein OH492_25415 [Vibrio chagasii]|nr:hypothetical protein [Vibrio chagasii]